MVFLINNDLDSFSESEKMLKIQGFTRIVISKKMVIFLYFIEDFESYRSWVSFVLLVLLKSVDFSMDSGDL